MATKRVAVVLIPNFTLAVFAKTQRSRAQGAIALVDMIDDTAPVVAINDEATRSGITCGMTVSQAQAFCPGLAVYQRDLIAERAEAQAITGWLGALSPAVHEESPGLFQLDASGMMLLYRDEATYADRIIAALRPLGYTVQVGLANNAFVARVAAERAQPGEYLIIPAYQEKAFLSGLGREYLAMSEETDSLLHDLGIKQIAQVSAIPINEMTERFGDEGNMLVTLSRGESCRSMARQVGAPDATKPDILSPDQFTTTRFFSAPLEQTAYLRRHINQLLGDLLERLKSFGQGCACVEIRLHLDNRTEQLISLAVEKPTASVRLFLRQWQTQSESLKLESGINGITVTIPHLRPLLIEQTALATHREPSSVPMTLPDSVHRAHLHSGILPEECFELLRYVRSCRVRSPRTRCDLTRSDTGRSHAGQSCDCPPQDPPERKSEERLLRSREARDTRNDRPVDAKMSKPHRQRRWESVGLRLFKPPRLVRMHTQHNQPIDFTWAGRHRAIIHATGPWELSGHWWQSGFHRRYYEIIVDTCQRYLVFCDETDPRWYVQGVFD